MTATDLYDRIQQAAAVVRGRCSFAPDVGIILGTGLGGLVKEIAAEAIIPYEEIPGFPLSTVESHAGRLILGTLRGRRVVAMQGRFHRYEGYSLQEVTFPVRVMKALGCETLIVTNAAGGLRADWAVGDLMQIADQIFFPGMAGHHPLVGPNDDRLGLRFPAMVDAFDTELAALAHTVAREQGTTLHAGCYFMLTGPTFESAGELRFCRTFADAVGMSTAPEVVVARHGGMRVLGISLITNIALPDGPPANHIEVLEAGEAAKPKFAALLKGILAGM